MGDQRHDHEEELSPENAPGNPNPASGDDEKSDAPGDASNPPPEPGPGR